MADTQATDAATRAPSPSVKSLFARIRAEGRLRSGETVTRVLGRERTFVAYDLEWDTFIFERGAWEVSDDHASVLIVPKADLTPHMRGYVMTVSTGNHSVAAIPLLTGKFWGLSRLPASRMSETLAQDVIAANIVGGVLEISQRDVATAKVVRADAWLTQQIGFPADAVIFCERNEGTLKHYRRLGEEWRVKPLAWTPVEMRTAIAASRKRISTKLEYFHSARGVHFLSFDGFRAFARRAKDDFAEFSLELEEMAGVYESNETSFLRQPKIHGHHEIEFFGVNRRNGIEMLVPRLERLLADIRAKRADAAAAVREIADVEKTFRLQLTRPEFADPNAPAFTESLYMHLTGEIYAVVGDGTAPAFDDRRTALPGATFRGGVPRFHPGADARTRMILSNVRIALNKDERVEYANVYELRSDADIAQVARPPREAVTTREVVLKTTLSPLEVAFVEKRLATPHPGYGAYVLARIAAFKQLGVYLPEYHMLRRRPLAGETPLDHDHYIRTRCEGDPLERIPRNLFRKSGADPATRGEDPAILEQLAFLMGSAAAQNMAMKKYVATDGGSCLYGTGKEIYSFKWNTDASRYVPAGVWLCSVRGSCGWPDVSPDETNYQTLARFYMTAYAKQLRRFASAHPAAPKNVLAERFLSGFRHRTRVMLWNYTVHKDEFDRYAPPVDPAFGFADKWRFVLDALKWQADTFAFLKVIFISNV